VFGKYAGAEFKLNGEVLLLMEASEVKGTITTESTDPGRGSVAVGVQHKECDIYGVRLP
jgi:hypothetical protein